MNIVQSIRTAYIVARARLGWGSDAPYKYTREVEAAAQAGDTRAQARLATAYHEGIGIKPDAAKAFEWAWKAAHAGHPGMALFMAGAYDVGRGVAANPIMAAFYATLSMRGGNEIAGSFYRTIYRDLTEEQRDILAGMVEDYIHEAPPK